MGIGLYTTKTANAVLESIRRTDKHNRLGPRGTRRVDENTEDIWLTVKVISNDGDNKYTVREQIFNDTDPTPANHAWEDLNATSDFTATGISDSAEVGKLYRIKSEVTRNGSTIVLPDSPTTTKKLIITAPGGDDNTYTADIIDNRTDQTVVESAVTLKALDHDNGVFPNGVILDCTYDSANSWYEAMNYGVFYA